MIIVQPYPTPEGFSRALHESKVDFIPIGTTGAYALWNGASTPTHPWANEAPTPEARILLSSRVMWYTWQTRPDTGIKTIQDMRGRKVSIPAAPTENTVIGEDSLRAAGIDPEKDVTRIPVKSTVAACKALIQKKTDAVITSLGGAKMEEIKATTGLVVLPFPKEVYDKLDPLTREMGFLVKELPAGYLGALDKPMLVCGRPEVVLARTDMKDDTAYLIVKTILEHARELDGVGPDFKVYGHPEDAVTEFFVAPYHPGAIRYLKEKGIWKPAHDAMQKELLAKLPK